MPAPPVCDLDLDRMRRERLERLRDSMRAADVDVLCTTIGSNSCYASGVGISGVDAARAAYERVVVIVTVDAPPIVLAPRGARGRSDDLDMRDAAGDLDDRANAQRLAAMLPAGRLAIDDCTMALAEAVAAREPVDAAPVMSRAKIIKTPDELECIRRAQEINELAMLPIVDALAPGVHTRTLAGELLARACELGAEHPVLDPVFQVMPERIAQGPFSVTGDPVFPTTPRDSTLDEGDVIWVDTGVSWNGYHSDFGRTWVVGEPSTAQRAQHDEWHAILRACTNASRPGATGADITRAAASAATADRPWLGYFYVAHGIGTVSAEMPLVGTDLGPQLDASLVLAPGMVLVFEPVVWEEGIGGYRAEEIVAITEDGTRALSEFTYRPFPEPGDPS